MPFKTEDHATWKYSDETWFYRETRMSIKLIVWGGHGTASSSVFCLWFLCMCWVPVPTRAHDFAQGTLFPELGLSFDNLAKLTSPWRLTKICLQDVLSNVPLDFPLKKWWVNTVRTCMSLAERFGSSGNCDVCREDGTTQMGSESRYLARLVCN